MTDVNNSIANGSYPATANLFDLLIFSDFIFLCITPGWGQPNPMEYVPRPFQQYFSHIRICEIILKLGHPSRRGCHLKFFSIFSSGGHFFQQSENNFSNFGRRSPKEHFCEIILKSFLWSRRRCHLKVFLFQALAAILFSRTI